MAALLSLSLTGCDSGSRSVIFDSPAPRSTTTTISAPSSVSPANSVRLTATVSPSGIGGTVGFYDATNPNKLVYLGEASLSGGTAVFSATFTRPGTRLVQARYAGDDPSFAYSDSASSSVPVSVADTSSQACGLGAASLPITSGVAAQSNQTYSASGSQSAVCVANTGSSLTLTNSIITSSSEGYSYVDQSQGTVYPYDASGISAAALAYGSSKTANSGGSLTMNGGSIATTGSGIAGVFASGMGSSATLTGTTISTAGTPSYGAEVGNNGSLTMNGGSIAATGTVAAILDSGSLNFTNTALSSTGSTAATIEMISTTNSAASTSTFTMNGGSLSTTSGVLFYLLDGQAATISLTNVTLTGVNTLLQVYDYTLGLAQSITLNVSHQILSGGFHGSLNLQNASVFTGICNFNSISLDTSSQWVLTGNDSVYRLSDAAGIQGTSITNIVGNGHTISYSSAANPSLGGQTYALSGGGLLKPQ
ncbi:MAG TPA: Ig-like domain repeat protein [Acidobacteriaceae bacterium]